MTNVCRCGHEMVPAVRYDADGRHETQACFRALPACVGARKPKRFCEQCGTGLNKDQTRYCSLECRYVANDTRVSVTCPCGARFLVPPSIRARGKGKHCSVPCALKYRVRHTASVRMAS